MSSQPVRAGEQRDGGSNIMKRMKSALMKSSKSSSSVSSASTKPVTAAPAATTGPTSASPAPTSTPAPIPTPAPTPTPTSAPVATTISTSSTATASTPSPPMQRSPEIHRKVPAMISNWSAVQQDRARALFAKYGLTLEPGEWQSPANMTVQRIDRPVRMRVHRSCHRCQTPFGPDKVCANCQHIRCKKCPRHPSSRVHDKAGHSTTAKASTSTPTSSVKVKDTVEQPAPKRLTLPSKTGGQDVVKRQPRVRVRRFCHKCNTMFVRKSTECANCQHIRCTKCPRDPPSLSKFPNGYPGDVPAPVERQERVWKKPRRRVYYTCHRCSTTYASGSKICPSCGQEKCGETIRIPPKKTEKEFDPDAIKSVTDRLARLKASA